MQHKRGTSPNTPRTQTKRPSKQQQRRSKPRTLRPIQQHPRTRPKTIKTRREQEKTRRINLKLALLRDQV